MITRLVLVLAACAILPAAARSPYRDVLTFSVTTNVGAGNEVFVTGNHGDVGNWDPTKGVKLVWNSGNVWTGRVGVQSGTALDYKPVIMPNSYTGICNPANAQWLPPGNGNHLTTNSAAQPGAPYAGKTIYYLSGFTNVTLVYSSAGGSFTTAPMTRIGPGRFTNEYLYYVNGVGEPGESLQFLMTDGVNYDHAPYAGYVGGDYYTALDEFVLQDGNIFNYWPPTNVSAPRIINSNVVSTFSPSPNRAMNIYLPRGYDQNTWKRYPVVYMHDGENVFAPGGTFGSWDADLTATKEMSQGRMREAIIVGLNSTANRTREYLPPEDNYSGVGFGDAYSRFLVYNVKAKIDAEFRTQPDRSNTVTIGASSGGLIVTYLGWATNVFGKIGPLSPAYLISPNFNNRINSESKKDLRIFTETGNVGDPETNILPATWTVLNYFMQDGYVPNVDLVSKIGCGASHGETAWAAWLPDCYRFLLSLWDEPNLLARRDYPPRITNSTPVVVQFASQSGVRYQLQTAPDVVVGPWTTVSTSQTEMLPWSNFGMTNGSPATAVTSLFYRIVTD